MSVRLADLSGLGQGVQTPAYRPHDHGVGILHLGLGAFHRAHQAVYTDDALAAEGGDWRIIAANLRSREPARHLREQNGLYTVLERGERDRARIIGVHADAMGGDAANILVAACNPEIRILSLTVSEKGYAIDRAALDLDVSNSSVTSDLLDPSQPTSVPGIIATALARRHADGHAPFTVLSCDNLPENGRLLKAAVAGYIRRVFPDLTSWLEAEVAFPSTMVDRITPATTEKTLTDVEVITGRRDLAAVETEPFSQWVIEDNFSQGRPAWEAGGAQLVANAKPYEEMKLRMLNGAHSLIAYGGQLLGHPYVRDAVADPLFCKAIERHMACAGRTLPVGNGLDPSAYQAALMERFANPSIAHATAQIANDCTEKLPQRWFSPAAEMVVEGRQTRPYAFALATWTAWLAAMARKNASIGDIREAKLMEIIRAHQGDAADLCRKLLAVEEIAPLVLRQNNEFVSTAGAIFKDIETTGYRDVLNREFASRT